MSSLVDFISYHTKFRSKFPSRKMLIYDYLTASRASRSQNCRAVRTECREILFAKLLIDECHVRGERDEISLEISIGRVSPAYNHLSLVSSSIMRYLNFIIVSPGILTTVSRVSVRVSM